MLPIRGGPTARNPAIRLAESEPASDLEPDELAVWVRLAPIADARARTQAAGGTCVATDAIGFRFLCKTIAWCERMARSDLPRTDPEQMATIAKLAEDALAGFFLTPADCLVN